MKIYRHGNGQIYMQKHINVKNVKEYLKHIHTIHT